MRTERDILTWTVVIHVDAHPMEGLVQESSASKKQKICHVLIWRETKNKLVMKPGLTKMGVINVFVDLWGLFAPSK